MSCFCHPLPEFNLCLAGFKGKPPLTPAAPQAAGPEALAEKTFVVKVPFTQDFLHTLTGRAPHQKDKQEYK